MVDFANQFCLQKENCMGSQLNTKCFLAKWLLGFKWNSPMRWVWCFHSADMFIGNNYWIHRLGSYIYIYILWFSRKSGESCIHTLINRKVYSVYEIKKNFTWIDENPELKSRKKITSQGDIRSVLSNQRKKLCESCA